MASALNSSVLQIPAGSAPTPQAAFQSAYPSSLRPLRRENDSEGCMRNSYPRMGNKFASSNGEKFEERFSAEILRLPVKQVARTADVSVDTVKAWRAGKTFPNGAALMRAAKGIPSIHAIMMDELRRDELLALESDRVLTGLMQALSRVSQEESSEGRLARRLMQEMQGPNGREFKDRMDSTHLQPPVAA